MQINIRRATAIVAGALIAILLLAGCAQQAQPAPAPTSAPAPATAQPTSPAAGEPADIAAARAALEQFLGALAAGDYAAAAELYGGDYEVLRGYNPPIDPADHAALLQAACTANGFMCLQPAELRVIGDRADELTFGVTFTQADGSPFVFTPPPGAEGQPRTEFPLRVSTSPAGPRVLDLPPYVS